MVVQLNGNARGAAGDREHLGLGESPWQRGIGERGQELLANCCDCGLYYDVVLCAVLSSVVLCPLLWWVRCWARVRSSGS